MRVGRRTWAPLWLRQDGAALYLPDPDGTRSEEPSVAFEQFEARLRDEGFSGNWQPSYNAKANPVVIRLRRADLERPVVQELSGQLRDPPRRRPAVVRAVQGP